MRSQRGALQSFKILVVEDFEDFRRFICSALEQKVDCQLIQASDGLEAVQKTEELQPDLILLDIGLPSLNGLEVARRARKLAPGARILFLTQESSPDIVQETLNLGALGYVHKQHAHNDLLPAVDAVLGGKRFVSSGLKFTELAGPQDPQRHEILFCSNDAVLLDGLARFIGAALTVGNAAIVWATESHRDSLLQKLQAQGVDMEVALRRGTYISSDISEPPDPARILGAIRSLSDAASKVGKKNPRVAVCGERAGRMWAEGETDAAIQLEKSLNELAKSHAIDTLCVYPSPYREQDGAFKSICAEHTAVSFR